MDNMVPANEALRNLMAEMILDRAIREFKEKTLYREIDEALAQGDEEAFLLLTSELRALLSSA